MKKLSLFVLVISIIMCLNFMQEHYVAEVFNNEIINYYVYSNTVNNITGIPHLEVTSNGAGQIIKTNGNSAIKLCSKVVGFAGECAEISSNNLDYITKKLRLQIIEKSSTENGFVVVGYSPMFSNFIVSGNKKINVQIAIKNNSALIGYPLILHGF